MTKEYYYKNLFRAAAIWSWLISVSAYIGNASDEKIFRSIMPQMEPAFVFDMAILPIFLFGFAFWWVSRDLRENHAVVVVGSIGGILAFVSIAIRALTGDISYFLIPVGVVDLIFGILMLEFLLRSYGRT